MPNLRKLTHAFLAFVAFMILAATFVPMAKAQTPPATCPTTIAVDAACLEWDYPFPAPAGFTIERKPVACSVAGTFVEVAGVPALGPAARAYLDPALPRGATYCYRAFAVGLVAGEKSPPSNTVEKIIPPAPVAPGLRVR